MLVARLPKTSIIWESIIILIKVTPREASSGVNLPRDTRLKSGLARNNTRAVKNKKNTRVTVIMELPILLASSLSFLSPSAKIGIKTVDTAPTISTEYTILGILSAVSKTALRGSAKKRKHNIFWKDKYKSSIKSIKASLASSNGAEVVKDQMQVLQ